MGFLGQYFSAAGLGPLETLPDMKLVHKHLSRLGADAIRVLCALLARPLVADGLPILDLRCLHDV